VVRGKEAAQLSQHFLTDDYVDEVLFKLFSEWISTEITDDDKREELYRHAQAIKGFKGYLRVLESDKKQIEQEPPS